MEANTEIYNIYFDKDINCVVMEWDGYATSKQFKQGTELMLNTLIQNNCSKSTCRYQGYEDNSHGRSAMVK